MKLYSMPSSGNSYKVRLLLALTGQPCDIVDVEDSSPALEAARTAGALPFGKAPVLEFDDGTKLAESNAILVALGRETPFLPQEPMAQAQMLSWMFWEQNQHEGVIAVRGALQFYPARRHLATPERMAELLSRGNALLAMMDAHLQQNDWLLGAHPSLADIALYGYTHTAGSRGGFDMTQFGAINAWLARMAAQPGYIGLDDPQPTR
ncbi:glutathione S-transferase family protein [Rhodobacteraceae bacterium]|nr:glutathione S-transferase family protein [Paracoccaceae bacterium]